MWAKIRYKRSPCCIRKLPFPSWLLLNNCIEMLSFSFRSFFKALGILYFQSRKLAMGTHRHSFTDLACCLGRFAAAGGSDLGCCWDLPIDITWCLPTWTPVVLLMEIWSISRVAMQLWGLINGSIGPLRPFYDFQCVSSLGLWREWVKRYGHQWLETPHHLTHLNLTFFI